MKFIVKGLYNIGPSKDFIEIVKNGSHYMLNLIKKKVRFVQTCHLSENIIMLRRIRTKMS